MRLSLLGTTQLTASEGQRIEIGSRRQRQLLAVLGLHRARVVDVDRLATFVWGDGAPGDPAAAIQTLVSRLRRLLSDPLVIETSRNGYVLGCPEANLDLTRFQQLVDQVRTEPLARRPELAVEALELWLGTPLSDLDHPDIEAERQRLLELRVEVTESLAESLCRLGRHAEAVEVAGQVVREHPYRERPVATLMQSLYATGRQADALTAFADLRTRLLDGLGVDPSTELRDVEMAILRQDLDVGPSAGDTPADVAAHPTDSREPAATDLTGDIVEVRGRSAGTTSKELSDRADPSPSQHIRMCTTPDGTSLAYAVSGDGPPLVKAANWMTNLDYDWLSPVWRHWNVGLSRHHTLVRYDERGCGMSDWQVERFTFDAWVDDLAAVVDAVGLDRFPLLGVSQGGAVAIAYAVRHPERVSRLVLFGAYPEGRAVRAETVEEKREADLHLELAWAGWGTSEPTFRQVFTSQFMPEGTQEQWEAFNELQRQTCSAENAVRFMEIFASIDVVESARLVRCPTLIMHSRNELRVPFSSARRLAALIPDSQLVPLESSNHILLETEPAWPRFLDELEGFLAA